MDYHIGTFKTGTISVTYGQKKWLACDLSDEQIHIIEHQIQQAYFRGLTPRPSKHLNKKIEDGELTFDIDVIEHALRDFKASLIEYNETPHHGHIEHRVLLRPSSFVRDIYEPSIDEVISSNLCVVLNVDTLVIITAYWNAVNDQHETLQQHRYRHRRF